MTADMLALALPVHDRLNLRRNDEAWLADAWASPNALALPVREGQVWVRQADQTLSWIAPAALPAEADKLLLGAPADGRLRFAAVVGHDYDLPGANPVGLRALNDVVPDAELGLLLHALALSNWHEQHRHCPRCGRPTTPAMGGHVRRCSDGSEHYPRTDPAVIALVVDGMDRALLAHQTRWPPRWFSTLAGFVEAGESAEQALAREIQEEVGIRIDSVRYRGSQPWPFPSSLMLGYTATVDGAGPEPTPDGVEIAEAAWFTRGDVRDQLQSDRLRLPPQLSIARRLINDWLDG